MAKGFVFALVLYLVSAIVMANDGNSVFTHPVTQKNQSAFMGEVTRLQLKGEQVKGFTQQKRIAVLKRPLVSTGSIVLSPSGICIATRTPFRSSVKITTEGIWQQTGNQKTSVKKADDHIEIRHTARILIALFTADQSVLEKRFSLYFQKTEAGFTIGLRPKDRLLARIISEIVIEGAEEIHRIAIKEANGDETAILISDEKPASPITLDTCVR
jgi:hypothetical protein